MGSRIITIQRQARELGRLRTGYTDPNGPKGPRPVRSGTWIVTSHAEHYVEAAAATWGGTVTRWQPLGNGAEQFRVMTDAISLDAILPPGDPLSQSYEQWSRGGAQRRCDGMTEALSDSPCLCRAQWGENFHETAPRDAACKITSRLNVILPAMPDIGAWRVETHSFYSANEIAAAVDVLKASIGDRALIPVRLRIEQRTRVAKGKTKQFPVVAVELRGGTAGQVLAGNVPALQPGAPQAVAGGQQAPALEAAPAAPAEHSDPEYWVGIAQRCQTVEQLTEQLAAAKKVGFALTAADPVMKAFVAARGRITAPAQPAPATAPAAVPAPTATNRDLWAQIVMAAGMAGWDRTEDIEEAFLTRHEGLTPPSATPAQLTEFLADVQAKRVRPIADAQNTDEEPPF